MITVVEKYEFQKPPDVRTIDVEEWEGRALKEVIPEEIRNDDVVLQIFHNEVELNDETLEAAVLQDKDVVRVTNIPRAAVPTGVAVAAGSGGGFAAFIGGAVAAIPGILLTVGIGLGIGYALQVLINAIIGKPDEPDIGKDSPTYDFDTPQNTTRNGTPVIIPYGEMRQAGHILQAKTAIDGDGRTILSMLIGVGEGGETSIESICGFTTEQNNLTNDEDVQEIPDTLEINDNPASSFRDIFLSTRLGTSDQSIIPGFEDTVILTTPFSVVLVGTPPTEFLYTMTNMADRVEFKIAFDQGLFHADSEGDFRQQKVELLIRHRLAGSSDAWVSETEIIKRKNRSPFRWSHTIEFPLGIYEIEITRQTEDHDGLRRVSDARVAEFNEIINDDIAYVRKALVAVKAVATEQLHGAQPTITFVRKGIKCRVYTDTSTFSSIYTANPAWIILDLLTNKKYGLGDQVDLDINVDIDSFIQYAVYCDALVSDGKGGDEARCVCDIVLDERKKAWDWIYDILQTNQGLIFYTDGFYRVVAIEDVVPVMAFNPGNSFAQKPGYTNIESRYAAVEVQYQDRDLGYSQEIALIPDLDRIGSNILFERKESVDGRGITRASQAQRLGIFRVNANKLLTRYVTWKASIAAIRCEPGDIVEFSYPDVAWGLLSGLIVNATQGSIEFDQEFTVEAGKTYHIRVFQVDGTIEDVIISGSMDPGTYTILVTQGTWATVPGKGRPYTVGELNLTHKLMRIVDISINTDMTAEIFALEHNALVFSDEIEVEERGTRGGTNPLKIPLAVEDLRAVERVFVQDDGTLKLAIDITWAIPADATYDHADVYYRIIDADADVFLSTPDRENIKGEFTRLEESFSTGDVVEISVVSASVFGVKVPPELGEIVEITLTGNVNQPEDVTGFKVKRFQDILCFSWDAVADLDIFGYEIREGPVWEAAIVLATGITTTQFDTGVFFTQDVSFTATYLIKAINTVKNYSATATSTTITVDPRIDRNVVVVKDYRDLDWPVDTALDNLQLGAGGAGNRSLEIDDEADPGIYEAVEVDLGASLRVAVSATIEASQVDLSLTWDNATFSWDSTQAQSRNWGGPVGQNFLTALVEWRFGNSTPLTGSYETFTQQEQTFQYAQFRVTLNLLDPTFSGNLDELKATFDVPDITDSAEAVSVTGTATISYTKVFTNEPSISKQVTLIDAAAGDNFTLTNHTITGFDITIRDSGGTTLTSAVLIDWMVRGY